MSYLIGTNVLSELRRREPNPDVVGWFASRPSRVLFLSVLTLGEIRKGIENVPDRERRLKLLDWLEIELPAYFSGRILSVDPLVAESLGSIASAGEASLVCNRQFC